MRLRERGVIDDGRTDRDGTREGTAADLVARDDDRMLLEQPALERESRLDDGHGAPGAGTPAKTSWWKSRRPKRSSGHVMRNARPTTFSIGTKPLPGWSWL